MFKKISIILVFLFCLSCNEQKDFNSIQWKNWTESESKPNDRWLMCDDLLKKYDFKNYTKGKVINLLGSPTTKIKDEFHYYLGTASRGINTGTLIIRFENDSVVEVNVIEG
jgi:hypothetical protein